MNGQRGIARRAESGMVAAISWLRRRRALCLTAALVAVGAVFVADLITPGYAVASAYLVVVVFSALSLPRRAAFGIAAASLALTLAVMAWQDRIEGQNLLLVAFGVLAGVGVFALVALYDGVEVLSGERRDAFVALKRAEGRFRDTLDSSVDGLYRIDLSTGRFDYLSPSMARISGLSMDELGTMDSSAVMERIHPDDLPLALKARDELEREGVASFEFRIETGDEYRWYHDVTRLVHGADGRPLYRVGSLRDVTESRRRQSVRDLLEEQREELVRATTTEEITAVVARSLCAALGVDVVFFSERDDDMHGVRLVWDPCAERPAERTASIDDFVSDDVVRDLDAGRTVICHDVDADPRVDAARSREAGVGSWMLAPFRREGGWRFAVGVAGDAPRTWRDDEAELLAEVAARTFPRIERAQAERERRMSEELFKTIVTTAGEGIVLTDADGRITFVNEVMAAHLGYTVQEMAGRASSDFVDTEDLPELERHLRLRRKGVAERYDLRLVGKDGEPRWFLVNAAPIADSGGDPGEVSLFTDITERKERESALTLQAHILENVHDAICVLGEDYRIVFWNKAAEELFGWDRHEAIGRPGRELLEAEVPGSPAAGDLAPLLEEDRHGGEALYRRKDGSRLWVDVRSRIVRAEDGRLEGVVASFRDISEQRRATQALAWETARLRAIVDAAPVGLSIVAADGEMLLRNDVLRQMWLGEVEVHEVSDLSKYPVFWPDTGERVPPEELPTARALTEGRSSSDVVIDIQRFDGSKGTIVVSAAPIVDNGSVLGAVTISQDITGMREAEQALRFLTDEVRALHEAVMLDRTVSSMQLAGEVVARAGLLLGSDGSSIFLLDDDGSLHRTAGVGVPDPPGTDDLIAQAIGEQARQIRPLPPAAWEVSHELGSVLLAVPLAIRGKVHGAMAFTYQERRSLDEVQQRIAGAFADQAALAIENAKLRARIEEAAIEAERSRLARDLHDSVTQSLFAASLRAEALMEILGDQPGKAGAAAEEMRRLTRGALAGMRGMLIEMRPGGLTETALPELLRHLVEASGSRFGANVRLTTEGQRELPGEVQTALYRIAQEALNNVARHAMASRAWVDLRLRDDGVRLEVGDDGRGFEWSGDGAGHFGLGNMRERAMAIGAIFSVDSGVGRGTVVTVEWPFEEAEARDG